MQAARSDAGTRMAAVSQGLGVRLTDSAARYDRTDEAQRSVLDRQIAGGR
ncbi:MAG: type VII secretion target [Mycobacterium sp.]